MLHRFDAQVMRNAGHAGKYEGCMCVNVSVCVCCFSGGEVLSAEPETHCGASGVVYMSCPGPMYGKKF